MRNDAYSFSSYVIGNELPDSHDEKYLDISYFVGTFDSIMEARMDLAKSKGCDGIEVRDLATY